MTNKKSDEKQVRQKQMNINGYKVTLSLPNSLTVVFLWLWCQTS